MTNKTGKLGEDMASAFLIKKGYAIVERNYHSRWGEIDIIAEQAPYIVFAEVKTRRKNGRCSPEETVTIAKQQKIIRTALWYLSEHLEYEDFQVRFDVISLRTGKNDQVESIQHFQDAFEGELL